MAGESTLRPRALWHIMSDSQLFTPITLRDVTIRNRVWVSPMCQYSATDGTTPTRATYRWSSSPGVH